MEQLDAIILQYIWVIIPIIFWSFAWKGVALWKAARLGQRKWFIVLLVVNTVGILEIIYIFTVARGKTQAVAERD